MPAPENTAPKQTPLTERQAWKDLSAHAAELQTVTLKDLFAQDAGRGPKYTLEAEGLLLDYSKNRSLTARRQCHATEYSESGLVC